MITIYIIVFAIVLAFVLAMSIGLIFLKRPISGSCGGLDTAGIAKSCGCVDSCKTEVLNKNNDPHSSKVKHL